MRVLVTFASKHGSTAQIAETVADAIRHQLRDPDADSYSTTPMIPVVHVCDVEQVESLDGFDAVVVGSAVYMGRWLHSARAFVNQHAIALANLPLWLFSSGPIGLPLRPTDPPADIDEIADVMHIRGSAVFAGKLDGQQLHIAEKAVIMALRVPSGDFRDWNDINRWGTTIGLSLLTSSAAARTS